jgi:hypothetical protein
MYLPHKVEPPHQFESCWVAGLPIAAFKFVRAKTDIKSDAFWAEACGAQKLEFREV